MFKLINSRKTILFILVLALSLLYSTIAKELVITHATTNSITYYVSTTGNDNNPGTIDSPWRTIQKACNSLAPGNTVLVRGGTYNERIKVNVSGSKTDGYITIKNYPNEKPIIDGSNLKGTGILNLNGQSYVHIEGFEMKNVKETWAYGIYMSNGESFIKIVNNDINNIHCTDPKSSNNGANGIVLFGDDSKRSINNILIQGNYVHDLTTGWNEAISVASNCEYVDIIENRVDNTGNIGIDIVGNFGYCKDPSLDQPRYCNAIGNIISNANSPNATSYGLYTDGARDVLFDRNIIFDSQGGIEVGAEERVPRYPAQNITVTNNLVFNNSKHGITIGGYNTSVGTVKNVKLYNNTTINNGGSLGKELNISVVDGLDIRNNIFFKNTAGTLINNSFDSNYTKNLTFKNNIYYSQANESNASFKLYNTSIKGFTNWINSSNESNSMYINPQFSDKSKLDFTLLDTSPAINSGDTSVIIGNFDLKGDSRHVDVIDIGAYELQIPTTPPSIEPPVIPPTDTNPLIDINVDGNLSDWATISPIYSTDDSSMKNLKVYNDDSNLYISVEGLNLSSKYTQFFIDSDNNLSTGFSNSSWKESGIEFLVENNSLYKYAGTGTNWSWEKIGSVSMVKKDNIEVSIPHKLLNLTNSQSIHIGYSKTSSQCLPEVSTSLSLINYTIK